MNQRRPLEPRLLAGVPDEEQRALGPLGARVTALSAISSRAIEPEPSSSAPFTIESSRAGRSFRMLSTHRADRAACSALGSPGASLAPRGRITLLYARSESWSTAGTMPIASLCAPSATYSPRSAGSEPSSTATTLLAPQVALLEGHVALDGRARVAGTERSSGLPKSFGTLAEGRISMRGWVTPGGTAISSLTTIRGVRKTCSKVAITVSTPVTAIPETRPSRPCRVQVRRAEIVAARPAVVDTRPCPCSASRGGKAAESDGPPM